MNGRSDKLHTALLTLLRSGLWERELDNSSCFPLSEDDWEMLFTMSRQQTVTGIVFQGLQYLPDGMFPPETLLIRWTVATLICILTTAKRRRRQPPAFDRVALP